RLLRAALVVRTLAFVATFMPMKPASPEQTAPRAKEMATIQLESWGSALTPRRIATTTTNTARTRYSAFRNAMAPLEMWELIVAIFSVPTSCFETQDDLKKV